MTQATLPPETDWISGHVAPERVGAYKRFWGNNRTAYFSWWNGRTWGRLAATPQLARHYAVVEFDVSLHQRLPWKGLSADPAKRKPHLRGGT